MDSDTDRDFEGKNSDAGSLLHLKLFLLVLSISDAHEEYLCCNDLLCCVSSLGFLGAVKWYKPGATQSEFEYDKAQCTAEAYQQFPVANVSNTIGQATTTPILTTCQSSYGSSYGTTNCTTTGGQYQPYDANTGGRGAAFKACMYGRGYTTEAPAASGRPPPVHLNPQRITLLSIRHLPGVKGGDVRQARHHGVHRGWRLRKAGD